MQPFLKQRKLLIVLSLVGVISFLSWVLISLPGKRVAIDLLVEEQDVSALIKNSPLIVIGTIRKPLPSQLSVSEHLGDKIVFTDYALSVEKTIKGSAQGDVIIRLIGGTVGSGKDKFSMFSDDEVDLKTGEKTLLFLSKNDGGFFDLPKDHYIVQGRFQGKYQITNEKAINHRGEGRSLNEFVGDIEKDLSVTP